MSERDSKDLDAVGEAVDSRRGGESVESGGPAAAGTASSASERAGENVRREAQSEEGIPPSAQGDGAGDHVARTGNRHKGHPAVGDVGA